MSARVRWVAVLSVLAPGWLAAVEPLPLADFSASPSGVRVEGQSATSTVTNGALRVDSREGGRWPGVTLLPVSGAGWDLSARADVEADLRNPGAQPVTVHLRVDNPGADGTRHCLTGTLTLGPRSGGTCRVPLRRHASHDGDGRLFGMRGYPVRPGGADTLDPGRVNQLVLFLSEPPPGTVFEVRRVRSVGAAPAGPSAPAWTDAEPFLPFVDTFGQYKHRDWPGKVRAEADFAALNAAEQRELAELPGPSGWTRHGGWAEGPRLAASGFFRVEKLDGRWWLVDPEGALFFSTGVTCVRMHDTSPVEERDAWFEEFPGARPEFASFFTTAHALKGHYAGRRPRCFSFGAANLLRRYGQDWAQTYPDLIHRRLRSWGLNTIANWSDEATCLLRRTPYTDTLSSRAARRIEGSEGYWGQFPDPFADGFARAVGDSLRARRGKSVDDPWCIGFFCDNELGWGDDTALGLAALRSPPDQPAKRVAVEHLRATRDLAALNTAWGASHASWEALLADRAGPDPKRARAELRELTARVSEEYFSGIAAALREGAPNQLFLGCRFAWANEVAVEAAARHCDVVSHNRYALEPTGLKVAGPERPLLIGEFHFGALDRGLFHTGLVPVEDQAARADAYRRYVEAAARDPLLVGSHWFQYKDQPLTGRVLDGENYQIGFVNLVDTPYPEMTAATRALAARLYPLRAGKTP